MDLGLDNRVIIVSGGARGIGEAITNAIAAEGGLPIVVDPLIDEGRALINSLERQGLKAHQIGVRLVSADDCAKTVKEVKKRYGRIDGVVNNAGKNDGIGLENGGPKAFVQSVTNNLFHCYYLVHYALPFLIESQGSIVNISSKTAVTGQGGTSGYAAAKGAQLALTREWAVELLKYQIRVNAVIPAEVMTPMYASWIQTLKSPEETLERIKRSIPLGNRMTSAEEIASMTVFLLSAKSSHITGQHFFVDGGYVHLDRALSDIRKDG